MVVDNKIVAGLRFPSARPQRILNRQGSWELIAIPRPIPLPPRSCGPTSRISTNALPRLLSSPMIASRAKRAAEFKPLVARLREACNACHDAYMKTD